MGRHDTSGRRLLTVMTRCRAVPPGRTTVTTMQIDNVDGSEHGIQPDDRDKFDVNHNHHAIDDLTATSMALRGCSGLWQDPFQEASRHGLLGLGGTSIGNDHALCVMCCVGRGIVIGIKLGIRAKWS
jgi:hypothetical protein